MTKFSLHQRFTEQGTVSEPDGIPKPQYALPSTVNWMRAYAILIKDKKLDFESCKAFYASTAKRSMAPAEENSVFEHLLLALHQLAALKALISIKPQADIARVASVAWYYGIYAAASAMIAALDGSVQDNHTKTANAWDRQLSANSLVPHPFDLRVTTLVKKDADSQIDSIRKSPKANLVNAPKNADDAHQAICSYLSGTCGWWQWKIEEEIKRDKDFKALGVTNFRTKAAQEFRDNRLKKQCISFLHQAFRFRGKANYREALYLAHGKYVETSIATFVGDMAEVLEAFTAMAGAYCSQRLGKQLWDSFLEDIDKHRSFSLNPRDVWE